MKRVPLAEATPGMILAKPVASLAGQLIVPSGRSLDVSLIASLLDLGLTSVHVENCPGEEGEPVKSVTELEQALDHRFRRVADDPDLARMRETIRRHLRALHRTTA
ncbi:MAG: hypothetical protein FJ245_10800 [Nitrospira sp.]|nr:hypothetical protein [Nitrospira sp.]